MPVCGKFKGVMQGPLFDHLELTSEPFLYSESSYAALSRSAQPAALHAREALESWYADYPDPDGDLWARFRQSDPRQHYAAWWELYVYTLLRRLNFCVQVHPAIPGSSRRPDMLATRGDARMFVECAVIFDSEDSAQVDSEAWLKDCINASSSPDFGFSMRIEKAGRLRSSKTDITKQIENWVATLDYDAMQDAASSGPVTSDEQTFIFADWHVRLTAIRLEQRHRSYAGPRLLFGPVVAGFPGNSVEGFRRLLKKKATQCRGVQDPLVVAILGQKLFARDQELDQALFGTEQLVYRLNEDLTEAQFAQFVRQPDGFWYPRPPVRGGRISGVLFAEHLYVGSAASRLPTLWTNPWADNPLPEDLPFPTRTASDRGDVLVESDASAKPHTVFHLPEGWPGH